MKMSLVLVSVLTFLFSCNENRNGKLAQKIDAHITEYCKEGICTINLSKITPFKWDRFYLFKETTSLEVVERVLNQEYPYFTDIGRRIIFLDDGNNIVYHEDIFPNVEGITNKDVIFYMPDTVNFKEFINPNFTVKKEKTKKGYYYILIQ